MWREFNKKNLLLVLVRTQRSVSELLYRYICMTNNQIYNFHFICWSLHLRCFSRWLSALTCITVENLEYYLYLELQHYRMVMITVTCSLRCITCLKFDLELASEHLPKVSLDKTSLDRLYIELSKDLHFLKRSTLIWVCSERLYYKYQIRLYYQQIVDVQLHVTSYSLGVSHLPSASLLSLLLSTHPLCDIMPDIYK